LQFEISIEKLRECKLFVASPQYGGMCTGNFTRSMMDLTALCSKYGMQMRTYFLFNESLITRARNYCVDEFLRSDATHLMFIDADITFNANDVIALVATQLMDPENKNVVAAAYPKKCITWEKIKAAVDKGFADNDPNVLEDFVGDFVFNPASGTSIPLNEPAEVSEAGTGFMLISRETFEKYAKAYPEYMYVPDHARSENFDGSRQIMTYFDCFIDKNRKESEFEAIMDEILETDAEDGKDSVLTIASLQAKVKDIREREKHSSKRYLSEDYMFCQNVRRAGMKVWMCPWIELKHSGFYTFGGKLAALAAIGASATVDKDAIKKVKK
jgi:hypothetical protein